MPSDGRLVRKSVVRASGSPPVLELGTESLVSSRLHPREQPSSEFFLPLVGCIDPELPLHRRELNLPLLAKPLIERLQLLRIEDAAASPAASMGVGAQIVADGAEKGPGIEDPDVLELTNEEAILEVLYKRLSRSVPLGHWQVVVLKLAP